MRHINCLIKTVEGIAEAVGNIAEAYQLPHRGRSRHLEAFQAVLSRDGFSVVVGGVGVLRASGEERLGEFNVAEDLRVRLGRLGERPIEEEGGVPTLAAGLDEDAAQRRLGGEGVLGQGADGPLQGGVGVGFVGGEEAGGDVVCACA
jgi:hypothetical protein